MQRRYRFHDIEKQYPLSEMKEIPKEYSEKLVSIICKYLPEIKTRIEKADEETRRGRVFGNVLVAGSNKKPMVKFIAKSGVVRMAWVNSVIKENGEPVILIERSIMNPDVSFKNENNSHGEVSHETQF